MMGLVEMCLTNATWPVAFMVVGVTGIVVFAAAWIVVAIFKG